MKNDVFLLLGSNIDKEKNLPAAVELLAEMVEVVAVSPVYETAPVGLIDQPSFFNAVVRIRTDLMASAIKQRVIGRVEQALNRVRQEDKNAPRTIDADIILFNDEIFTYDGRHIPDPDLLKFPHAAVPLADLVPEMPHPETEEPFRVIAARLRELAGAENDGSPPIRRRTDILLGDLS